MDERDFLKKIRALQEGDKKIGLTYLPKENKETNLLSEGEDDAYVEMQDEDEQEFEIEDNVEEFESEGIENISPDEQREEENKFKGIVSKLCKFEKIKVHQQNVEWSGHLIREKLDWVFSLDDTIGVYIKTDDFLQLKDENLEVLKKLRGYYEVWSDEWAGRLTGSNQNADGGF